MVRGIKSDIEKERGKGSKGQEVKGNKKRK